MVSWQEMFTPTGALRHHSFLVAGGPEILDDLRRFLVGRRQWPTADWRSLVVEQLTIDHSRELKALTGGPISGSHRLIALACRQFTPEAIQALLKWLEEPPAGTILVVAVPLPAVLPATIRSRVWLLAGEPVPAADIDELWSRPPAERLARLAKFQSAGNETTPASVLLPLLAAAEAEACRRRQPTAAAVVYRLRRLSRGPRLSLRLLLEYLALVWPRS